MFDKSAKDRQWGNECFFNKCCWDTWVSAYKAKLDVARITYKNQLQTD